MTTKILVSFSLDCGRHGSLDGVYVTTKERMAALMGKRVYFGEVLGKHSEVVAVMEESFFTIKSEDPLQIAAFEEFRGANGFDPEETYLGDDHDEELPEIPDGPTFAELLDAVKAPETTTREAVLKELLAEARQRQQQHGDLFETSDASEDLEFRDGWMRTANWIEAKLLD